MTATAVEPSLEFVSAVLFAVEIPGAHDGRVATRIRLFRGLARCGFTGCSTSSSILVVDLGVAFEKFEQEIVGTRSNGGKVNLFLFADRLELFLAFAGAAIAGSGVVGKVLVEFWALHNHW